MDLHTIQTYLRPMDLRSTEAWSVGWAWLAGGTWLFSEPQPHLTTLVDLEQLNWSEIEWVEDSLCLGATCTFAQLLNYPWTSDYPATAAFKGAIAALAASFKVTQVATIGGNLCLALAVGVMAPLMVLLDATYELWRPNTAPRLVAAREFQVGVQQTRLQPGEVLRRIWIPQSSLVWQTQVQRLGIAATDPALSLVMAAHNPISSALRVALGACVPAPVLLEFSHPPTNEELAQSLQSIGWLQDARASAVYRQQATTVLIQRSLAALLS